MQKGYLDYGYDQSRDAIFNFDDNGRLIVDSPLNNNNYFKAAGYPLNFVGFKNDPNAINISSTLENGIAKILQPGAPGDHFEGNAKNITGVTDCNAIDGGNRPDDKNYSIDIDEDSDFLRFGQHDATSCVSGSNTRMSPRVYKIGKRVAIACGHFQAHYVQCGEMLDPPVENTIRFFDDNTFYDIPIQAQHGRQSLNQRYRVDRQGNPGACGVPDGVPDVASTSGHVVAMTNSDLSLIITKTDIPDTVPTLKLISPEWLDKYTNEVDFPDTAQATRIAISIDQNVRPLIRKIYITKEINPPGKILTQKYDFLDNTFENYNLVDIEVDSPYHNYFNVLGTRKHRPNYSNLFENLYGDGVGNTFFSVTKDIIPFDFNLSQITIDHQTYVPTEKALQSVVYDFRDSSIIPAVGELTTNSDVTKGDSGSVTVLALGDGTFGLVGFVPGGGPTVWFDWGAKEAFEYIFDMYGLSDSERPVMVTDENYPFEDYSTPISKRPSLGYKVYKSLVSSNGPWYDITAQAYARGEQYHNENVTGVPCIDPAAPCYIPNENFVDEYVNVGDTYYYYTTSIDFDGVDSYFESNPSNYMQVTIPSESKYTDSRNLFIDNNQSSTTGFVSEEPANQSNISIPDVENRSTEYKILEGWRGGDYQNSIPFFGNITIGRPQGGLYPRPMYLMNQTFCRIDGGNANNSGIYECPMPIESHSFPYLLGLPYDDFDENLANKSNYVLSIFANNDGEMDTFRNGVNKLNLTRYDDDDHFEPFYHSNFAPALNVFPNLDTLRLNPAGYGNYRQSFSENWDFSDTGQVSGNSSSYIGYWIGEYLRQDLQGSSLNRLEMKDSSVSGSFDKLEYFNVPTIDGLTTLDLSNNQLYAIDFNSTNSLDNNITNLNLANNNLGLSSNAVGGKWLDDDNIAKPAAPFTLFLQNGSLIKTLDLSNNPSFSLTPITPNITLSELETARVSNSKGYMSGTQYVITPKLTTFIANNYQGTALYFRQASLLRTLDVRNTNTVGYISCQDRNECSGFGSLRTLDISGSNIGVLNLAYYNDEQDEWAQRYANGGQGSNYGDPPSPGDCGSFAGNIQYIHAENSNLRRLFLPDHNSFPKTTCANIPNFGNPNFDGELELLDIRGTRLGINGSLDYFFNQSVFSPTGYPPSGEFFVNATGIVDEQGNPATLSLTRYNQIVNSWSNAGKTIILNVDVS